MILMPQRKKLATLIVGGMKKPDFVQKMGDDSNTGKYETPGDDEDAGGKDAALKAAMARFSSAVKSDDVSGMVDAMQTFLSLADGDEDSEDQGEAGEEG